MERRSAYSLQSQEWSTPREPLIKLGCLEEREEGSSFPDPCLLSLWLAHLLPAKDKRSEIRDGERTAEQWPTLLEWPWQGCQVSPQVGWPSQTELNSYLPIPHPSVLQLGLGTQQMGLWDRQSLEGLTGVVEEVQQSWLSQARAGSSSRRKPATEVLPGEAHWTWATAGGA